MRRFALRTEQTMTATPSNNAAVGLLLSGGLDSCILLGHLLAEWSPRAAVLCPLAPALGKGGIAGRTGILEGLRVATCWNRWSSWTCRWPICTRTIGASMDTASPTPIVPDEAVYLPGRNALLTDQAGAVVRDARHRRIGAGRLGRQPVRRRHRGVLRRVRLGLAPCRRPAA